MQTETKKSPQELLELYDQAYAERVDTVEGMQRLARLLGRVPLAPSDRVADFGCGSGLLMPYVAPRVQSYVGVDFSEAFIAMANARLAQLKFANATFRCESIEAFAREHPHSFDVSFAMDFSEHVYDDDWLAILRHVRSTLVDGGRFYLHTPNGEFFIEQMKKRNFILKQFPEHIAIRTPSENAALIERAGFRVQTTYLLPHYNVLRFLHPLSHLPGIGRYLKARIFLEAVAI